MNPDATLSDLCRILRSEGADSHPWREREQAAGLLLARVERDGFTAASLTAIEAIATDLKWEVRVVLAEHLLVLPEDHLARFAGLLGEDDNQFVKAAVQRALDRHRKGVQAQFRRRRGILDVQDQYDLIARQHGQAVADRARRMAERLHDVTLGGAVHELRGVLTPLLSTAEALQALVANPVPDTKALRRQVPRLVDRVHLMHDLLEDLRDFSQATPRERTPELLAELVAEALKLVEDWFVARHLDLSPIRFEIAVPDTIIVPVCRLPMLMAIRNLLKNAVESLAIGPVTFRPGQVRARAAVVEAWVVLEIADTGAGLSADELAEIEEFVPGRCSRKAHGTGFGLPIACRKVRDHGGNLAIASALDEGTTITVTLPLSPSQDDSHADCCTQAPRSERAGRR
jgi:signal transduction histidine kinase